MPGDEFWNSGPLSPAHQQAVGDAAIPATQTRSSACRTTTCTSCHKTIHDHVVAEHLALTQLGPTQRCATCHREHNEPASFLVNSSDSMCVDCHASSSEVRRDQRPCEPVSGFSAGIIRSSTPICCGRRQSGRARVRVRVEVRDRRARRGRRAIEPQVLARPASRPGSRAAAAATASRSTAPTVIACEPDGEHFEPITMETALRSCHELTFDPARPTASCRTASRAKSC